jgi:UDP-3-O-[3-hydroxymyristoyl] glucosamine N-acyltransferase
MRYTLAQIVEIIGGEVHRDAETVITGVASLEAAEEGDISFAQDERYFDKARLCKATALVLPQPLPDFDKPVILNPMPKLAFGKLLSVIAQEKQSQPRGTHPTAVVADSAALGEEVSVGPHAIIGEGAKIGDRATIYGNAFVGDRCEIGDDSVIHANVSIREEVIIGKRVIIHCGAVIGADGYGYVQHDGQHIKVPQVGNVIIGDDVEIGAMTTIDRATMDTTVIGNGVKMDNHCHVAHNCIIGDYSLLVAYTRMGGGCRVGKGVIMSADVRMVDNVTIGDGAILGAGTGVMRDVKAGERVWGRIAQPVGQEQRLQVIFGQLPKVWPKITRLLKKMDRGEE